MHVPREEKKQTAFCIGSVAIAKLSLLGIPTLTLGSSVCSSNQIYGVGMICCLGMKERGFIPE